MKLTAWQKAAIAVAGIGALLVVGGYITGAEWIGFVSRMFAGALT